MSQHSCSAPGSDATACYAPTRSQGGFRLYTAADEERIRRMREYLARGVAVAEAARLAADAEPPGPERVCYPVTR